MTVLDRLIQSYRVSVASTYIPRGARVLDIGCADGALFKHLSSALGTGLGVDPELSRPVDGPRYRLIPGTFPDGVSSSEMFDAITMLAVLEHIPDRDLPCVAASCAERLVPGGRLILTIPSPLVDRILHVLIALRLL